MRRLAVPLVILAALIAFPLVVKDQFWQNAAVLALIFASAATAWSLLGGYAGQISFGHSLFFGIGAYATGYLVAHGVAVGFPVFRLRSHYFSIATIAMQQVAFVIVINNSELGAASGIPLPLKAPSVLTLQFGIRDKTEYYLVALGLFVAVFAIAWFFLRRPAGHYVRAIRDDEEAARSLGVLVRRYKLYAMALSAALTAVVGGYYAMYATFVDPTIVLGTGFSIVIALAAILGGATTLWGPLVGAVILIVLQQGTRTLYSGAGTGVDFVIYGALVIAIAIIEPRGIAGLFARARWRRVA